MENCYFFLDIESQTICAMCEACHNISKSGSFWNKENGYGPFKIECRLCERLIYDPEKADS